MRSQLVRLLSSLQDPEHARRAALLARNPLFEGLPRRTIGRLLPRMFEKQYAATDVIFHAGDPGRGLFVILEGEVEILRHQAGDAGGRRIALFGDNSAFGELALIDEHPRSATARALKATRVLILYRSDFESIITGDPRVALALAKNLMRVLAQYARSAASQPRIEQPEVAVTP